MFASGKTAAVSGGAPDDKFNYVTMLLHGDGTNGAQNNTFVDSSTNNFSITRNGNTTQGSFSPYGSNWSNSFNVDPTRLSLATATALGTGDVTVEFWFYPANPTLEYYALYDGRSSAGTNTGLGIFQYGQKIEIYGNGLKVSTASSAFALNTWTHFAVVRTSGTCQIYINGVASGSSASYSDNFTSTIRTIASNVSLANANYFTGYISNLREVTSALYSGTFTPSTTPLTAVSGTTLLTCQSNRFIDNSTNAYTITVSGNPSVQRFNPFGTSTAYSTSVIGGSGYFDGTGDYLSVANNSNLDLGAGDFTLEAWIYPNTSSGAHIIWSQWNNGGDNATQLLQNGTAFIYRIGATQWTFGSGTVTVGAWMHIAVSRSGSTVRMFVNGAVSSTQTDSTDVTTTGATVIGANDTGATPANIFNGYIAGLRQVKGTAVYTSAFTPPTSPPTAITNTQLLTNFTNGAIFDNAMMNDLETVGNAQISTSVVKYGTGSLAFDGTGDWLTCPLGPNLTLGASSDFTIECWFRANNFSTNVGCIYSSSAGTDYLAIRNSANLEWANGVIQLNYTIPSASTTTWYHLAVTRSGSTVRMFLNGSVVASGTDTSLILGSGTTFYIGNYAGNTGAGYSYNGYLDDFRITKGYARYTATFTPPTAAFSNTGPI